VPTRVPDGASSGVIELTGRHTYQTIFEPNVEDWTELMPGYMHVRFDSDLLISERSEPTDDIVERNDPYYVYLKPHGADDRSIRERMNYPGTPPVYIPMPPH
jgi:lipoprotein-releasing system ATP-binding protein